ncbi:cytidine deaminase [Vigna unguiculata]|uniref:Cytidine deaminase n=1 Tax=Vigna unguiculata TaxID=3917 RepID=A0A4D6MHK3_VIGUN|nr:cytidine deaminase [Vigna unguiculata]
MAEPKPIRRRWQLFNFSNLYYSGSTNNQCPPQFTPLSHFLPHQFAPHDPLSSSTPLLLETHHNALTLLPNHTVDDDDALCNGHLHNHKLKNAALEAANKSHASYTASPSGVILLDCHDNIYKGSYLEFAAFNPSLDPIQAVLVAFVATGGGDYHNIVDVVLVEKEDVAVKQEQTARFGSVKMNSRW